MTVIKKNERSGVGRRLAGAGEQKIKRKSVSDATRQGADECREGGEEEKAKSNQRSRATTKEEDERKGEGRGG